MAGTLTITKEQARRFILAYQGLLPPRQISGKDGILKFFGRVGCIQYDPLNIVGSNPELVLQSRVAEFSPEILEQMLYRDRTLLDGNDKMMSIYPTGDWPYFRYRQIDAARQSSLRNADHTLAILPEIRKAIRERGPLSSIDLEHDTKVDWAWGPTRLAKVALDDMYYQGELIIHHKVNTRKVYDFSDRHIPAEILNTPDPHGTIDEYHDWHILRRLRSLGLAWNRPGIWHGIFGSRSGERLSTLKRLVRQEKVNEIRIADNKYIFYVAACDLPLLDEVKEASDLLKKAAIIAPLDNILWDRELVSTLIDFSYRWEVYKPVAEREFGYYVLPVLYGDRFVGRFEPGRDRKNGDLLISNWWWEPGVEQDITMKEALHDCFTDFLKYLGGVKVQVNKKLAKENKLDWLP